MGNEKHPQIRCPIPKCGEVLRKPERVIGGYSMGICPDHKKVYVKTPPFKNITPPEGQSMDDGRRLRDEGMALVNEHEDPAWQDEADRVIRELAYSGVAFTAQDLTNRIGMPTRPNAVGARFSAAARQGIIEDVGYAQSTRAARHASRMLVWRGTIEARTH